MAVLDDEGVVLPGRDAVRTLLRATLTAILQDEGQSTGANAATAQADDAKGRLVMRALASAFVVDPSGTH